MVEVLKNWKSEALAGSDDFSPHATLYESVLCEHRTTYFVTNTPRRRVRHPSEADVLSVRKFRVKP